MPIVRVRKRQDSALAISVQCKNCGHYPWAAASKWPKALNAHGCHALLFALLIFTLFLTLTSPSEVYSIVIPPFYR